MAAAGKWAAARDSYADALKENPASERAEAGYKMSGYRLHPGIPGFEAGTAVDAITGFPKELTLPQLEIHLLLIGAGDFDMGSESRPDTKPVHTVHIDAFYLSPTELTQRQWTALMGKNPSATQGADLPVEEVSWMDVQGMLAVLRTWPIASPSGVRPFGGHIRITRTMGERIFRRGACEWSGVEISLNRAIGGAWRHVMRLARINAWKQPESA